ncbi:uncharacterized protein LOC135489407 [Lineus longissimus]|uniref:uncharacterized protein LOC135489407 n=1 Tax=Lineus longissimus TaxID=88925 RepID=UPI00315D6BAB
MSIPHHNWRDCKAWVDAGLPLSTTSNEAAKMYDACLTQVTALFHDDSVGGLDNSIKKMIEADPTFVMGHVMRLGLELSGGGQAYHCDPKLKEDVQALLELAKKNNLTDREMQHAEAVKVWAKGNETQANNIWEDILLDHPHDVLAIMFSHGNYFFHGEHTAMRDSVGRVLPLWNESIPLYGYLLGMHSLGLEETNYFTEAEALAKKGLYINPYDAWSTHTLAHVMEMTGRTDEGIELMRSTEDNWTRGEMFASHIYWHWGLFHIEKAEYEQALGLYDAQIARRTKSGALLPISDASSALYRLEMEGVKVGQERWDDLFEVCRPHLEDHARLFYDLHILMSCLGAKEKDVGKKLVNTLKDYIETTVSHNQKTSKLFGVPMMEAFVAYEEEDYAKAADLANAARYQLQQMGGSKAQRDVFHQFLVHAAMKSPEKKHHHLSRSLILEEQALRPDSQIYGRLMGKYLASKKMTIPHHNWRDCKAWVDAGLPLSTTSNEAAKMFDACLTQYTGVFHDECEGGIAESAKRMLQADPTFVMGHVMCLGLDLIGGGRSHNTDPKLHKEVDTVMDLVKKSNLSDRELQHAEAVKFWSQGYVSKATDMWQDILLDHPHDALAIKFSHDNYFFLGQHTAMRDSVGRVLPLWDKNIPLYGYLLGLHSFGLEETNCFTKAEAVAKEGLFINPYDAWSTHTLAHVMEMTDRTDEGIEFMRSTEDNWSRGDLFASHNYWHWGIFHIEKAEYEQALGIFDSQIVQRMKTGSMLSILDANSLLYRLEMEGYGVGGERWEDVFEICRPHFEDHALIFNDLHLILSCLGAKKKDVGDKFVKSLKEYTGNMTQDNQKVSKEFGVTMMEAFSAYDDQDYARAVELANSVRYKLHQMGGSNAQRDIFHQFLVHAAMKSPKEKHHHLCRNLILERQALRPDSLLNDRLMGKYLAEHGQ